MFFTFRIVKGYVGKWSPVDRIFFFLEVIYIFFRKTVFMDAFFQNGQSF